MEKINQIPQVFFTDFIAHVHKDGSKQSVEIHLSEVAVICARLAAKINMPLAGELIGLMHDFGKYSRDFQKYIQSATGLLNADLDEDYVDAKGLKGKIDHSSAGAQWIWQRLKQIGLAKGQGELCGQLLALCVASHHSGLIDCIDDNPQQAFAFLRRMGKSDELTHLKECIVHADRAILSRAQELGKKDTVVEMLKPLKQQLTLIQEGLALNQNSNKEHELVAYFELGHFTRFLFSCLIDADRINSADFEFPDNKEYRRLGHIPDWANAIGKLEAHLAKFEVKHPIDHTRQKISNECLIRSKDPQGTYTLSVPTGGGKTLASLRYALHHAKLHTLERIIFIIPYTSIIDQNARVVREILGQQSDGRDWVLEHHSNIEPERQTWLSKLIADNWDAPIIFTTMVQYLEANFNGGTRGVRRLHQLANSVLIFDEIQTLPISCVHLFANSLNFFKKHTRTTSILCTATQPLLNELKNTARGKVELSDNAEIMGQVDQVAQLFDVLERVEILPRLLPQGWSLEKIVDLIITKFEQTQSVLVIVNTKTWAQQLYKACQNRSIAKDSMFHLSTYQCPAHRKVLLDGIAVEKADGSSEQIQDGIRQRLAKKQPVLCISTQLIEAGVDISAATVIRFLAGLDSIAQAAGRCNRHGEQVDAAGNLHKGQMFVINPSDENLDKLIDIKQGRDVSQRIFDEIERGELTGSVLSPQAIQRYFKYYFHSRSDQMNYPFNRKGVDDNLLNLLSVHRRPNERFNLLEQNRQQDSKKPLLSHAFKQAGTVFNVIDAPTRSVIVPYAEGEELIADLGALDPRSADFYKELGLLQRRAQKYSVNVFPHVWQQLQVKHAVREYMDTGIYILEDQCYTNEYGLSIQGEGKMPFLEL